MRFRPQTWFLLSLLLFLAGGVVWHLADEQQKLRRPAATASPAKPEASAPATGGKASSTNAAVSTRAGQNQFRHRLANTTNTVGQLTRSDKAILLENALIDTAAALPVIPKNLRATGDPGSYIVQARGPADNAFRARLAAAGATVVAYIPNNAYLVRATAAAAQQLAGSAQAVLPYEPYYKLSPALLGDVMEKPNLPPSAPLAVVVFPDARDATVAALQKLGAQIMAEERSPFGPVLTVMPAAGSVAALAGLPGVENIAKTSRRIPANDLSRARVGVAANSVTTQNYMNLAGTNVLVELNDSSVDATHPDLLGRVFGAPADLTDFNGHGTHVAGIIAGDGTESTTVSNAIGSIMPGTTNQFRGKAPAANLFIMSTAASDRALQEAPALTNALISNNSWTYGNNEYDIFAASYDAAVRDALPETTGSQPVLFVFAAGNAGILNLRGGGGGGGNDNGLGGNAESILSPATAKNVITVGAIEMPRHITNDVVVDGVTNKPWAGETDSQNQVAAFSSRGNVGIGVEGDNGRFKPDVVAPGTWVVSTRSSQWDTNAYYSNTNYDTQRFTNQVVNPGETNNYAVFIPGNALSLTITISQVNPAVNLPLFVNQTDIPTSADGVGFSPYSLTPPALTLGNTLFYSVANPTNVPVTYTITATVVSTNDVGDYYQVLAHLNDTLVNTNGSGQNYYRYETGTSMSAADVSGELALIQDFFTNKLNAVPSPALLKAMVINGARSVNTIYDMQVQNTINYQGWGLINLPDSIPAVLSNATPATAATLLAGPSPVLWLDQNPTNALATGDRRTFQISVDAAAQQQPLRFTLVWTDPPGNPAAGVKLVNNLDLVVTNLDTGDVFYGNDIQSGANFNFKWNTNTAPNFDTVNNVENVYLAPPLGTNYSITVIGRAVNVNAVTAQTNNVSQDYALVISSGNGAVGNALTVSVAATTASLNQPLVTAMTNEFAGYNTGVSGQLLQHQRVGANFQLLGTNAVPLAAGSGYGTNGQVTLGVTNQWRFYILTNTSAGYTNAAIATFLSPNMALSRGGAADVGNPDAAARPEADIDLYVSTSPGLTNLDPAVIASCVANLPNSDNRSSLTRGGTEYVVYSNANANTTYYIGVKSEDQQAAEFSIMGIFSQQPFSEMGSNGVETVFGINLPAVIPDGSPALPGVVQVVGIAVMPVEMRRVVVTNTMEHQNFGDLIGVLNHNQVSVTLNNHTYGNGDYYQQFVYEDNGEGGVPGAQHTDGPGNLTDFMGGHGEGVWLLTEADNALTHTGRVDIPFLIRLDPQANQGNNSVTLVLQPHGFGYDFIDVPPNATNLTICVANESSTPFPLQLYVRFGDLPTQTVYDYTLAITGVSGCLSIDLTSLPPLKPGRYYVGVYNPNGVPQTVNLSWTFGLSVGGNTPVDFTAATNAALLDDAINNTSILITNDQIIASANVGIVVNHPRISDLSFTLVSPAGKRVLLMENRGGATTNGAGSELAYTNTLNVTASGGAAPNTNTLAVAPGPGVLPITYNFYTVRDEMTVFAGTNPATFYSNSPALLWDTGFTNNPPNGGSGPNSTLPVTIQVPYPAGTTNITIIMNLFGNPYADAAGGDAWVYTAGSPFTNYEYLMFTEDTNLATVPIKYAVPPFNFTQGTPSYTLSDFERATNGNYLAPTNIYDTNGGWYMPTNELVGTNLVTWSNNLVGIVTDPADAVADIGGSNYLALAGGTISRSIPTVPGQIYNVTFWYRGPGIAAWWRGEGNATDSADPENLGNNGSLIGRFNFPAGEVGQAFQMEDAGLARMFAGTNTYVQIRQTPYLIQVSTNGTGTNLISIQSSALDVGTGGGFTVEGWINPANVAAQQPLVEWLARVPTNAAVTNLVIEAGPFLNPATGHYYYLLGSTNWDVSEFWATQLGGHLATVETANEENWIYDTFSQYGTMTNSAFWIGLTNSAASSTNFFWSSGLTNAAYTNWATGLPTNVCSAQQNYVAIFGPTNSQPGLWTLLSNNGLACGVTNRVFGVVEVPEIQTNGVQFWISVTNTPGTTNVLLTSNGCLYANLVDVSNVSHEIFSAPGLIQSNVFQHVALTYSTNSGVAALYYNGTNVATTNLGVFTPKTTGDVLLGRDMSRLTNNYFSGKMDEMSIYRRALSPAEITAIYQVSALTTNRNTGKFDPSVTPAYGLAEAQVVFGNTTNVIFGVNNQWRQNSFTFTATSNSMPLEISGIEPGILLDAFSVSTVNPENLYYLPEVSLQSLVGDSAKGVWTLEIWDNRAGGVATNAQLVSWELQFILQTNTPIPIALSPQTPATNTVPAGEIAYFTVDVPLWAKFATNILVSSIDPVTLAPVPVSLLFNPTNPPTGANPGDFTLLANSSAGIGTPILSVNPASNPPLLPGQRYYLGVTNPGPTAATVALEVDFDITGLTNGAPLTGMLTTNARDVVRYFSFDVTTNAYEATFQLLQLTGNADLVVRKGTPLPTLTSSDAGSYFATNAHEDIYLLTNHVDTTHHFVITNSLPVPLSPGRWYLGVFKRDTRRVTYSVLAKELAAPPAIIDLTNNVPFNFTAGPGAALTNFFRFRVTNSVPGGITNNWALRFELYNLTGNGDLTVQTNLPPFAPQFFQSSQQPGLTPELVIIHTNSALTNLNADWYLGVPNYETNLIAYTILAVVDTNGYFPAFPGAQGAGGGTLGGRGGDVYHVVNLNDDGPGSLRYGITSFVGATNSVTGAGLSNVVSGSVSSLTNTSGARTIVFDVSGTITLASPLVVTNPYITIAGQTAPGCCGITIAGQMTTVQDTHDVVVRDVRFRRGMTDDSLMLTNVANVVADHVSAEWSDTAMSTLNSSNVTVQWSIIADSLLLTNNPPPLGSLLRYGNGALSFHHNLYADNYSGSPRLGDNVSLDFVNNVVYDWGAFPGFSANDTNNPNGFTNQLNYVCNYVIASTNAATNTANIVFWGGSTNTWIYQTNNFGDFDTNGVLNGADGGWAMFSNKFTPAGWPFPASGVTIDEAFLAYEKVLDFAGATRCRDSVDSSIVTGVRTQTGTLISAPPLAGMIGWWKGEGNANDSVSTNNGTTQNVTYTNGEVGQAFVFVYSASPPHSRVTVPDQPIYALTNSLTIESWINLSGTSGNAGVILWRGDCRGGYDPYFFQVNGDNTLGFSITAASGSVASVNTSVPLATNRWYHVAGMLDGNTGNMYIYTNGVLATQANTSLRPFGSLISNQEPCIGIGNVGTPCWDYVPFNGAIDEVSLYKRALSAAEIAAIYNAGSAGKQSLLSGSSSTPPTSGLVSWWKAEHNTLDSIGNNNGTAIGGLTYTNGMVDQPFILGQAFSFNGAGQYVRVPWAANLNLTNQLTIEFWMKADLGNPMTTYQGLVTSDFYVAEISMGHGGRMGVNFSLNFNGGTTFWGTADANGGGAVVSAGVWHHVAGTYDGNKIQLYIDGQPWGNPAYHTGPIASMPTSSFLAIGSEDGRTSCASCFGSRYFNGLIDEPAIYNRALSASEIQAIYNSGKNLFGAGTNPPSCNMPPFLDSDHDGLPDFWESTFGQNPTNASNNQLSTNANYIGYTDLEEYLGWLAGRNAFTVTNSPVNVDLYKLAGKTGNLTFLVTNSVNGTVVLINDYNLPTNAFEFSNSVAVFTPSNNFSGYASFDLYVTNNDTVAWFGPLPVSVLVSAVPILYATSNTPPALLNNLPDVTLNELTLLTVTNTANETNPGVLLNYSVTLTVNTAAMTTNGWPTNYATTIPAPSIDANGVITWTPSEAQGPGIYTITTVVTDNGSPPASATNSFSVTVNETNSAPFWPTNVPSSTNYVVNAFSLLVVSDTATDADIPTNVLTYTLFPPPTATNAAISTNGLFTWMPTAAQASNTYTFTVVVTDTNAYALTNRVLSATNSFTVTVLPPLSLTNGLPQTNSLPPGGIAFYLVNVPTNAVFATNLLIFATNLPVNVWFTTNQPPTITNPGDVNLLPNATSGLSVLTTNSAPALVPGGSYFLGVQNTNSLAVTYAVAVNFYLLPVVPIINLTNGVPFANTNSGAGNATDYYHYAVTNAPPGRAQFEIINPSGDLTLVARKGLPLPGLGNYDYISANPYTNDELIVVLTNSTPVPLTTGDWYLAAVNLSGGPVVYSIKATEWPATVLPTNGIAITGANVTSNEFCFTWNSLPGEHYYIQAKTVLSATNWVTVSPTLTATGTNMNWCVGLPSPYHFFRVVEGIAVSTYTPPPVIHSVTVNTNGVTLTWNGPLTAQYHVQWANSLPPAWNTFTNTITSATGTFTFTDNGSQTGGLASPRFYRLLQLP